MLEMLQAYAKSDYYPLHMPGHKRRMAQFERPFDIDITEIEGFDNLHHCEGILRQSQERAAALYGAEETFYLVNGSTCGLLSAVSACVPHGGRLLMARNCHKAVYHAALLNRLHVTYLYPCIDWQTGLYGSVLPDDVEAALKEQPGVSAVLITSPTYDGVCSDLRAIAGIVHRAGAVLIVDGAHGAHFGMHQGLPKHALSSQADIVINSLHKTLPSLTQTALLHVQGGAVDRGRLKRYLGIYQTSSPSYVLMAGMDACIRLLSAHGEELFGRFMERLDGLRTVLGAMKVLRLVSGRERKLAAADYDRSKVLIATDRSSVDGPWLASRLRDKYHLEVEMAAEQYVTAIMTVADTSEGFSRLLEALLSTDALLWEREQGKRGEKKSTVFASDFAADLRQNEEVMTMAEAEEREQRSISLAQSAGCISAEFVYLYPPGIPLLVPGERITNALLVQILRLKESGLSLQGLYDYDARQIRVIKESIQD